MAYRKIHIGKDIWQYTVGGSHVHIKGPNGVNFTCKKGEVGEEIPINKYDRMELNTVMQYAVKPELVKKFLLKKTLK